MGGTGQGRRDGRRELPTVLVARLAAALALVAIGGACSSHQRTPSSLAITPVGAAQAAQSRLWLAGPGLPLLGMNAVAATLVSRPSQLTCITEKTAVIKLLTSGSPALPDGGDPELQELFADETSAVADLLSACTSAKAPSAVVNNLAQLHATINQRLRQDGFAARTPGGSAPTSNGAQP